jgi:hypothetical protein
LVGQHPAIIQAPFNHLGCATAHDYALELNRREIVEFIEQNPLESSPHSWIKPAAAVATVLSFAYAGSVYFSSTEEVAYNQFFETALVANSLQAPVAVIAIVLAAMATIAAVYLIYDAYSAKPARAYASIEL